MHVLTGDVLARPSVMCQQLEGYYREAGTIAMILLCRRYTGGIAAKTPKHLSGPSLQVARTRRRAIDAKSTLPYKCARTVVAKQKRCRLGEMSRFPVATDNPSSRERQQSYADPRSCRFPKMLFRLIETSSFEIQESVSCLSATSWHMNRV